MSACRLRGGAQRAALAAIACPAGSQWATVARAEEGGSGHYLPGSMASFMDAVSPKEMFALRYNLVNYDGSIGVNHAIPIAGLVAGNVDASSWAHGFTLFWRPPVELGDKLSYAMSMTVPYVFMDVSANVAVPLPGGGVVRQRRTDEANGLGDIVLMPLMLNYMSSPDYSINFRLGAYAPTGSYKVGRLANTGKNFWTIEPTVAFMYFGQKNGREWSTFVGVDFNQENPDTNYRSGTQTHFETTLVQHFPFHGGLAGAGLTGYWYQQISGDSGTGANFGEFKGKTAGIGPVVSWVTKVGGHDLLSEFKWLHETSTEKRLEGDTLFLKVLYKVY